VALLVSNFGRQVDSAHIHEVFDLFPLHAALQLTLLCTVEPGIASCQFIVTQSSIILPRPTSPFRSC
jgi:hypothetical protein